MHGLPVVPSRLSVDRRGVTAVMVAIFLVFVLGMSALAVDIGYLYMSFGQLQTCADAAALAGAQVLAHDGTVKKTADYATRESSARSTAVQFGSLNRVGVDYPSINPNNSNDPDGDVVVGYVADPEDKTAPLDRSNPALYNAVQVKVRKNSTSNGQVAAFFSRIFGNTGDDVVATATSLLPSSVVGFKVTSESGNSDLMPFAIKKSSWDELVSGTGADEYTYGGSSGVSSGSDGILELNLYPLENGASGNFGTVDIGNPNNSTADLSNQIRYGVTSSDLSYFGGSLSLGSDGTLQLNGDTGVSAGIKDDLEAVKGKPRVICLYTTVSGNGNNATYTIVGFVGVRIVKVKLTGNPKHVIVQPAAVIDASALIGDTPNSSNHVYSNVRLIR